jgi:hypothetical protein
MTQIADVRSAAVGFREAPTQGGASFNETLTKMNEAGEDPSQALVAYLRGAARDAEPQPAPKQNPQQSGSAPIARSSAQAGEDVREAVLKGADGYVPVTIPGVEAAAARQRWATVDSATRQKIAEDSAERAARPAQEGEQRVKTAQQTVSAIEAQLDGLRKKNGGKLPADSSLVEQLSRARQDLATAQTQAAPSTLDYQVKATYANKLKSDQDLAQWRGALASAQANYQEVAQSKAGPDLLLAAKKQVDDVQARYELSVKSADAANSLFTAAYAQSYALDLRLEAAQARNVPAAGDLATQRNLWQSLENQGNAASDLANTLAVDARMKRSDLLAAIAQVKLNAVQGALSSAEQNVAAGNKALADAETSFREREAAVKDPAIIAHPDQLAKAKRGLMQAIRDVARARRQVEQAQGSAKQAGTALGETQLEVEKARQDRRTSQFFADLNTFQQGLPENLKNPKTEADRAELRKRQNEFGRAHQFNMGETVSIGDAVKAVQDDLADERKTIASRPFIQATADLVSRQFGGRDSKVEDMLSAKLRQLQDFAAAHQGEAPERYQSALNDLLKDYGKDYLRLAGKEVANDAHWRAAAEVVRTAGAIVVGTAVTIGSGGNIFLGAAAGFGTYQAYDAVDNLVVAERGGDIRRSGHVSIVGLVNEGVHGRLDATEWKMAGVDLVTDAVSSLSFSGGAFLATKASTALAGRVLPRLVSAEGVSVALPSATGEKLALVAGLNAAQSVSVRVLSTAAGGVANQAGQAGGQMVNTAFNLGVEGKLFTEEGREALAKELKNQAFYTVAAAPFGGVTAVLPANQLLRQLGVNIAGNVAQSEGRARLIDGRDMNFDEGVAALIMGGPHALQMLAGNPHGPDVIRNAVQSVKETPPFSAFAARAVRPDGTPLLRRPLDAGALGPAGTKNLVLDTVDRIGNRGNNLLGRQTPPLYNYPRLGDLTVEIPPGTAGFGAGAKNLALPRELLAGRNDGDPIALRLRTEEGGTIDVTGIVRVATAPKLGDGTIYTPRDQQATAGIVSGDNLTQRVLNAVPGLGGDVTETGLRLSATTANGQTRSYLEIDSILGDDKNVGTLSVVSHPGTAFDVLTPFKRWDEAQIDGSIRNWDRLADRISALETAARTLPDAERQSVVASVQKARGVLSANPPRPSELLSPQQRDAMTDLLRASLTAQFAKPLAARQQMFDASFKGYIDRGAQSRDPNVREAATSARRAFEAPLPERGSLTGRQRDALAGLLIADANSNLTGSKAAGSFSGNALSLMQVLGGLEGKWETWSEPGLKAIRDYISEAKSSTDPQLVEAARTVENLLPTPKQAGQASEITPSQREAITRLYTADNNSEWISGPRIKMALGFKGRKQISVEGSIIFNAFIDKSKATALDAIGRYDVKADDPAWRSWTPELYRVTREYIKLVGRVPDDGVRDAAQAAKKAIGALPVAGSEVTTEQRAALAKLFKADYDSLLRAPSMATDWQRAFRADRSNLEQYAYDNWGSVAAESALHTLWHGSPAGVPTFQFYIEYSLKNNGTDRGTGFAIPLDPRDVEGHKIFRSGYRPNLIHDPEGDPERPFIAAVPQHIKSTIQTQLTTSNGLLRTLQTQLGLGLPVSLNLELRYRQIGYLGSYDGRPGYQVIEPMRLTAQQAKEVETAFYGVGTNWFHEEGQAPDGERMLFRNYNTVPTWTGLSSAVASGSNLWARFASRLPGRMGMSGQEWWRETPLGSMLPRETYEGPRRVVRRDDLGADFMLSVQLPFHLPAQVLGYQAGWVTKVLKDRGAPDYPRANTGTSPEALAAFRELERSRGGWTPRARRLMDEFVEKSAQSPDTWLKWAAEATRSALQARGKRVTEAEGAALRQLLLHDLRVNNEHPYYAASEMAQEVFAALDRDQGMITPQTWDRIRDYTTHIQQMSYDRELLNAAEDIRGVLGQRPPEKGAPLSGDQMRGLIRLLDADVTQEMSYGKGRVRQEHLDSTDVSY